jgi:hypothetical protein
VWGKKTYRAVQFSGALPGLLDTTNKKVGANCELIFSTGGVQAVAGCFERK